MLAEKLNMRVEDAESWVVNLIRNAEMDAKIDSKKVSHLLAIVAVEFVSQIPMLSLLFRDWCSWAYRLYPPTNR